MKPLDVVFNFSTEIQSHVKGKIENLPVRKGGLINHCSKTRT